MRLVESSIMTAAINDAVASVTEALKSTLYTKPKEPEDWLNWEQVEQPVEDEERKMYGAQLYRLAESR